MTQVSPPEPFDPESTTAARRTRALLRRLPWHLERGETADWHGTPVACVKRSRSRCVLRLPQGLALGLPEKGPVFAKRYGPKYWWRRIAWLVGQSKAAREMRTMRAVAACGFLVPEPLVRASDFRASYLLTRGLPGLRGFADELAELPPQDRVDLWRAAGEFTRRVWESGLEHPDYLQDHVCRCDDPGGSGRRVFALIDLDGVSVKPAASAVSRSQRCFNAMQLLRSTPPVLGGEAERVAFLEAAFADAWPHERDAVLGAIQRHARRERTKTHLEHLHE